MINLPVAASAGDRAIEWFVRLRADDVTALEKKEFFSWLHEDAKHELAFLDVLNLWDDLAVVKEMVFDELLPFPEIWEFKRRKEAGAAS